MKNEGFVKRVDKKKVDYIDGHVVKEGILVPVVKTKEIKMAATKRFHNCLHIILGLSKCERLLMEWLAEEMDEDNMIISDEHMRKKFIAFLEGIQVEGEVLSYKPQSVANSFLDLTKRPDLLFKFSKGRYKLNPEYYWRGNDKDRIDAIMMNIQFLSGQSNFKVIKESNDYVLVKKSMVKK